MHDITCCVISGKSVKHGFNDGTVLVIEDCTICILFDVSKLVSICSRSVNQITTFCSTVFFCDDDFLSDIDKSSCQITGFSSLQSGIGQTLTYTMRCVEEFRHRHTFTERGVNRDFDNGWLVCLGLGLSRTCHQTTHTCKLSKVVLVTTGTRNCHHVDW